MTARRPIVTVELTEEQKCLVPDWESKVAGFQRNCNSCAKDKRQRFALCLHEGGHAVQYRRQLGWDAEPHGPYVRYDCEAGKLEFVLGAVSPRIIGDYVKPLPSQRAMVSTSGFLLVEHFTGAPDDEITIQNDLKGLRRELGENADMNEAVASSKIKLEEQLSEPTFLQELKQACRDYEMDVYGTDEATEWGWLEYRPELQGKRHRVASPYAGNFGMLIEHDGDLKLLLEGKMFRPQGDLRGCPLEVVIAEPQKAGTQRVIERWNAAALQTAADVAGSGQSAVL